MTAKIEKNTISGLVHPVISLQQQQSSCELHVSKNTQASSYLPLIGSTENTVLHSAQLSLRFRLKLTRTLQGVRSES